MNLQKIYFCFNDSHNPATKNDFQIFKHCTYEQHWITELHFLILDQLISYNNMSQQNSDAHLRPKWFGTFLFHIAGPVLNFSCAQMHKKIRIILAKKESATMLFSSRAEAKVSGYFGKVETGKIQNV